MSTKKKISETSGVYFITFTCHQWLPMFGQTNGYDIVYKWFNYLKAKGHLIVGYVIMPNHVHALIGFCKSDISINAWVGNGKRFMAYELVKRLQANAQNEILAKLENSVSERERQRGKQRTV